MGPVPATILRFSRPRGRRASGWAVTGHRLVSGGANRGLMRALADATLADGGQVLSVMPRKLVERGVAHDGLTELLVAPDMHTRKAAMADAADAFLAPPGGLGTLEELCEAFVWTQVTTTNRAVC